MKEKINERKIISKENLRQIQTHQKKMQNDHNLTKTFIRKGMDNCKEDVKQ